MTRFTPSFILHLQVVVILEYMLYSCALVLCALSPAHTRPTKTPYSAPTPVPEEYLASRWAPEVPDGTNIFGFRCLKARSNLEIGA